MALKGRDVKLNFKLSQNIIDVEVGPVRASRQQKQRTYQREVERGRAARQQPELERTICRMLSLGEICYVRVFIVCVCVRERERESVRENDREPEVVPSFPAGKEREIKEESPRSTGCAEHARERAGLLPEQANVNHPERERVSAGNLRVRVSLSGAV